MIQRLKLLIYDVVLALARTRRNKRTGNTLLIIKTDEIGDYILWRNCAPFFKTSERFKDYTITFCGNIVWKTLAEKADRSQFDHFIWLDKKKFKTDMRYRYRFLRDINSRGFDTVINTIYSRSLRPDDAIVKAASARLNIGMPANENNVFSFEKGYDKHLYQELVSIPVQNMFDFYRNKLFTEKISNAEMTGVSLAFDTSSFKRPSLPGPYCVIFPGSNNPSRIWHTANFIETAALLHKEYNFHILVCGSAGDMPYTQAFLNAWTYPCTDLTAKTSLIEFLEILAFAQCIVSIDTGSVHLAAAVNCPVYGIFNGSQYGRFAPYPSSLNKKFYAIYPDSVEKQIAEAAVLPPKYHFQSQVDYNEVSAAKVIAVIQKTLPSSQPL